MTDNRQAGIAKLLILVILLAIIIGVLLLIRHHNSANYNSAQPSGPANSTNSTDSSADRVKAKNGPNSDTKPSPSGTGPGSDNSLLGQ